MTALVLYGDFNCPFSYLASSRVDALAAVDVHADWRAVEHDPHLLPIGRRDQGVHLDLEREMSEVRGLLLPGEELPWDPPGMIPNTEAAVAGYAEGYGAGVADDVRRVLFAAYWVDGADIGHPEVLRTRLAGPILRGHSTSDPLRESGYAVSASRGPITTTAWLRIRAWREEWTRLGTQIVPTLVHEGRPVAGVAALHRLADLMGERDAPLHPELPDPARFPDPRPRAWR